MTNFFEQLDEIIDAFYDENNHWLERTKWNEEKEETEYIDTEIEEHFEKGLNDGLIADYHVSIVDVFGSPSLDCYAVSWSCVDTQGELHCDMFAAYNS